MGYPRYISFDTTVRGGMPVTVQCAIHGAEKDVGIMGEFVDDIWLMVKNKRAPWLEKRLTEKEWDYLIYEALEWEY